MIRLKIINILTTTLLTIPLYAKTSIEGIKYTKEGYCIVESHIQQYIGLKRFKTEESFKKNCKGKMIFKYKKNKCRWFTMKDMKFDIFISDGKKKKEKFRIGERKELCRNIVIEEIINMRD